MSAYQRATEPYLYSMSATTEMKVQRSPIAPPSDEEARSPSTNPWYTAQAGAYSAISALMRSERRLSSLHYYL